MLLKSYLTVNQLTIIKIYATYCTSLLYAIIIKRCKTTDLSDTNFPDLIEDFAHMQNKRLILQVRQFSMIRNTMHLNILQFYLISNFNGLVRNFCMNL